MAVLFNEIPGTLRVPLFYAEVNSGGSVYNSQSRLLLIGQKLSTGSAKLDEPVLVASGNEDSLFGSHSMLAAMVRAARNQAPFQEIWCLPATDDAAGVAATGSISFAGLTLPVTQASTLTFYVDGTRYRISVTTADTAATLATKAAAAVNADLAAVVSATAATNVTTFTARHKGDLGNFIDIRVGYYGDEHPISNGVTIVKMNGGSANPEIEAGLSALGEEAFDWIACPYTDDANLDALQAFFNHASGRWSPYEQLYGHAITAKSGTVGELSAAGLDRNDPHTTLLGLKGYPQGLWVIVAAVAAKVALHLSDAPELSRPLQFIDLVGILPPKIADRFARVDRNTLLYDGISTLTLTATGTVQIERLISTYRVNSVGFEDATWLDINTLAQTMFGLRYLRAKVTNAHGRQALMNDDNPPIQGVSRPKDVKATIVAGYVELNQLAVFENVQAFERALIVERSQSDADRIDVYLPNDHVNQLRIMAVNATSFLQYPSNV